jgi:hypothetical protein
MTNSNPLLEKFYELYPEKKEEPKVIKVDEFEGEVTLAQVENAFKKWASNTSIKGNQIGYTYIDEISIPSNLTSPSVATSITNISITKPPSLTTYDPDDLKECFIKTAFEVKTGIAQIISMNMEMDTMGIHSAGAKITFEVYVHKF